jgi:hypothetical protein
LQLKCVGKQTENPSQRNEKSQKINRQRKNKHAGKYPNGRTNMKANENKEKTCRIRERFRTMPFLLIPHRGATPYEYADRLIRFVGEAEKKHRERHVCSVQATRFLEHNNWCITESVYSAFNKSYVEIHALILTVELLALLLRIRDVTGSHLGSNTNYVE